MKFIALLLLLSGTISPSLHASAVAHGNFVAEKACPAYVSKNKRSNPDGHHLTPGQHYTIFQLNRADQPTWYRITMPQASPKARWVSQQCGKAELSHRPAPVKADECTTAGLADSYKLALSWQPAFCETRPDKRECGALNSRSHAANNFTLHGLWPNKKSCGRHYGYCGEYSKNSRPKNHCSYRPVPMSNSTLGALKKQMPSAEYDTCLQRHQWFKHGTCQTLWNADEYYNTAIRLTQAVNASSLATFMRNNIGRQVETTSFLKVIDSAFGNNSHQRISLHCRGGNLVEIRLNLPQHIPPNQPLPALLKSAPRSFANGCSRKFRIDDV